MYKIAVVHGPNLNLLGQREPDIYGRMTLEQINQTLQQLAESQACMIDFFQSNHEGALVDYLQRQADMKTSIVVINPAGLTHTSVVLRDTLLAINIPFIEVHLSNIQARESFRRYSYFSDIALGTITGFGAKSYELAFYAAMNYLKQEV